MKNGRSLLIPNSVFARALEIAHGILKNSEYRELVESRYSTFDSGKGKEFEEGKLTLEDLIAYIGEGDQLEQISGRQEYYENLINRYVL